MESTFRTRILALGLAAAGCTPGLPTESPEADAANPDASAATWTEPSNPFSDSAFEGEDLDGGGHEHMDHGHMNHGQADDEGTKGGAAHEGHGGHTAQRDQASKGGGS